MRALSTLHYEEVGEVARVTLLRPRINMNMVRELTAVCDHLEDDSPCKVVVFLGKDGRFTQGIDFGEFRADQAMDIHGFNKWEKLCVRVERLPKVTIAAMQGEVTGGGVQLALVCDSRLAAPDTVMQLNEVQMGFLPGMATFRLAKYVGLGRAKRLIMRAEPFDAHRALSLGIIDEVFYDLEDGITRTIAAYGPMHTVTIALARRLLNEGFSTSFEEGIGNFLAAQHRAITQSAFLDTVKALHKKEEAERG